MMIWYYFKLYLLLCRCQGQAIPEGQDSQGDAAQTDEHKEDVVDSVEGTRELKLISIREKPVWREKYEKN